MIRRRKNTGPAALRRILPRFLGARLRRNGRPFAIGHHITNRCMCSCASCLWKDNESEDVSTADLKRFYKEASNQGFKILAITGGEPFLRKDLGELVRYAKEEAGMSILLFTTGHFLVKRMHEVLPWIDALMISVDSADPDTHDEIRGLPGLFDRMSQGVRLARQRYPRLSIQLNTCVQDGIASEVDPLLALAADLGVRVSFDVITEQRNGVDAPSTEVGLDLHGLQTVCADLLRRKRGGAPIVNSERYFDYFARGKPGYRCHLPKLVMYVDGRGNVEDCLQLSRPIANITEMPLEEIMELPRFSQLRSDAEACSSCNSPTMVDMSNIWERPWLLFRRSGLSLS